MSNSTVDRKAPDFPEDWRVGIIDWAQRTDAVSELWLFGSRAKGTARPDSDVDIAVAMMPPIGADNWALGQYFSFATDWRRQLEKVVQHHVSFTAIVPNTPGDTEVRSTGILLWKRI